MNNEHLKKCEKYRARGGAFAKFAFEGLNTQKASFVDHHKSKIHRDSVMNFLGVETGPRGKSLAGAPPNEQFKQVWTQARKGSFHKGLQGVGSVGKCGRMAFMLREAICKRERRFLRSATNMCIQRDESDERLVVDFRAVSDLGYIDGVLGLLKGRKGDADSIAKATGERRCSKSNIQTTYQRFPGV
jgi:hypothetical protein